MKLALYANTHGIAFRDEVDLHARPVAVDQMQPVQVAQAAERAGFHSMWFPDHVCMPVDSDSEHTANASGTRAYAARHNMLDAQICMSAVAASTQALGVGTTCLISPYRHPLSDARQLATLGALYPGRLMVGVAAGWMAEEYAALGLHINDRNSRLAECIEIYRRCWRDELVGYEGDHYHFESLSMDPKPAVVPPIVYGAITPAGARRAAKLADGLYPMLLDPQAKPDRFADLQEQVKRVLEDSGKGEDEFLMLCASSARISNEPITADRPICTGTAEQVLEDLAAYAANGYSMVVLAFDCPSASLAEFMEQIHQAGEEILPEAEKLTPGGSWKQVA